MNQLHESVIELAMNRIPPAEIGRRMRHMRITRSAIYTIITLARRRGMQIPRFTTAGQLRGQPTALSDRMRAIMIPRDVFEQLKPHADRRRIAISELARRLLQTIADDELVDSVLDDATPN